VSDGLRVLVSVGTDHHLFDRLMGWVETWVARAPAGTSVVVQHGSSRAPVGVDARVLVSQAELRALMVDADVVVLQGGPGGIIDSLVSGRRPIAVPRLASLDEVVDDHQVAFCRHLAGRGQIEIAEDEKTLHAALDRCLEEPGRLRIEPYVPRSAETAARVGALVDELLSSR
jgi:UDP-N-acetylglucosamine transferase subunit ALG13